MGRTCSLVLSNSRAQEKRMESAKGSRNACAHSSADGRAKRKRGAQPSDGPKRNSCTMNTTTSRHSAVDHREGFLAKSIEEQTAKLPSDSFLWLALGSIATSLT